MSGASLSSRFAAILFRMHPSPLKNSQILFSDVAMGMWWYVSDFFAHTLGVVLYRGQLGIEQSNVLQLIQKLMLLMILTTIGYMRFSCSRF
uniref:Uncharacterized protein n=1 Tax=Triticum urartu TaxID=4572 RepID=A0A8R7JXD9_TRIUA